MASLIAPLFQLFVVVAIFVTMLGMGLELRPGDFRRVVAYPRAAAFGLSAQLVGLPLIGILVGTGLRVSPEIGAGIAVLAACPGGTLSNTIVYLARGNAALSITLTSVSNVAGLVTVPVVVNLGFRALGLDASDAYVPVLSTIRQLSLMVILPVALGMGIRARWPDRALRSIESVRRIAFLLFVVVFFGGWASSWSDLVSSAPVATVPALTLALASVFLGYCTSRAGRTNPTDAFTISIEVSVQNIPLAILIVFNTLERPEFFPFVAVYGTVALVVPILWAVVFRALATPP